MVGSSTDTDQNNREPGRNRTQRLRQQNQQREECKNQHCFHTRCIWIHATAVNKDCREFTTIDRKHGHGIQGKDQRHTQRVGSLDTKLCIQIGRSPEKEEPPNTVGHKFTGNESPSLFKSKALPEADLLLILFFYKDNAFFVLILFNIIQFRFIDMLALTRCRVHEDPQAHPNETKRTDYDKRHFPTPSLCQQRNGYRSDQSADRSTSIKDRSGISTVFLGEILSCHLNGSREVTGFTQCQNTAGSQEEIHTHRR